jgi:hypothetical protein
MEVGEQITGTTYPNLIHAQGEVPEEAPEKLFQSEDTLNPAEESEFDEDDSEEYDESSFY